MSRPTIENNKWTIIIPFELHNQIWQGHHNTCDILLIYNIKSIYIHISTKRRNHYKNIPTWTNIDYKRIRKITQTTQGLCSDWIVDSAYTIPNLYKCGNRPKRSRQQPQHSSINTHQSTFTNQHLTNCHPFFFLPNHISKSQGQSIFSHFIFW